MLDAVRWIKSVRENAFDFKLSSLLARRDLFVQLYTKLEGLHNNVRENVGGICLQIELNSLEAFDTEDIVNVPFTQLKDKFDLWLTSGDSYYEWGKLSNAKALLHKKGLAQFCELIDTGTLDRGLAVEQLRHARAEALWKLARQQNPNLAKSDGPKRTDLVETFKTLELGQFGKVAGLIRTRHRAALPRGALGGIGTIRDEIARKRGHKPIRKLMRQVGPTIQQIKPIFLMSPISVAQFIPPGAIEFDLLVIDEARTYLKIASGRGRAISVG